MATMRDRLANSGATAFVGRADVLGEVNTLFHESDKLIYCISGVAGIGKTWLIREIAARVKAYGWRVVLVDINNVTTPTRFLEFAARELMEQGVPLRSEEHTSELQSHSF